MTEETSKFSRVPSRAAGIRDLRGDDLRVLIAMGQHVDKAGNAHPSLSRIGALTGVSRKNVPRSIERLEKAGLIAPAADKIPSLDHRLARATGRNRLHCHPTHASRAISVSLARPTIRDDAFLNTWLHLDSRAREAP